MRRPKSKYPSLGILDALFELVHGWSPYSENVYYAGEEVYESFKSRYPNTSSRKFRQRLYRLDKAGLVDIASDNSVALTRNGYDKASLKRALSIKLTQKKAGRHKRLIVFDLPEERRFTRDVIRRKLVEFGCKQIQKSVYLSDNNCESEIRQILELLGSTANVKIYKIIEVIEH